VSIRKATVAIKPAHRGERGAAVNTIAQGMPVDPAKPVVTAACFFCCRRAMGEALTRHSLRPLFLQGAISEKTPGAMRRGTRGFSYNPALRVREPISVHRTTATAIAVTT
jgi:hypothetical protein